MGIIVCYRIKSLSNSNVYYNDSNKLCTIHYSYFTYELYMYILMSWMFPISNVIIKLYLHIIYTDYLQYNYVPRLDYSHLISMAKPYLSLSL